MIKKIVFVILLFFLLIVGLVVFIILKGKRVPSPPVKTMEEIIRDLTPPAGGENSQASKEVIKSLTAPKQGQVSQEVIDSLTAPAAE